MKRLILGLAAAAPAPRRSGQANAGLITAASDIPSSQTIDFSQFSGGFTNTNGNSIQIGVPVGQDIDFQSTNVTSVIGNDDYGFGSNSRWNSGRIGFTGLNAMDGDMTFRFNDGPVSSVGGFLNYAPFSGGDVVISALAMDGSVLEKYNISVLAPIDTPNGTNEGAFRGITRVTADIAAFRVSNSFVALDNLTFSSP